MGGIVYFSSVVFPNAASSKVRSEEGSSISVLLIESSSGCECTPIRACSSKTTNLKVAMLNKKNSSASPGQIRLPILVAFVSLALTSIGSTGGAPRSLPKAVESAEDSAINLASEDCGSACVMVFAKVGESFTFEFLENGLKNGMDVALGIDAMGEDCELPEGLTFNQEELALEGMPQVAGFHEFIVLVTEKGVTREKVVLIDIEESSAHPARDSYATTVWGSIR